MTHPAIAGLGTGRCLVIGEVALTHDGSLGLAHAFVDAIANAGADAVKFQTHIAAAESTPSEPFRVKFSKQDKTRYDYWKRMEFTEEGWRGLAEQDLITPYEAHAITRNEVVLQDLRIRLHYLAGRREDRLVFDHQIEIARQLGLGGKGAMAPSDLLMRRYYLAAKAIWRFNQILLANFTDRVTPAAERKVRILDLDFQVVNQHLDLRDDKLFEKRPGMMLEAFRRLQDHPDIERLGSTTLRALSRALPGILDAG